jgi:hypothetical protein
MRISLFAGESESCIESRMGKRNTELRKTKDGRVNFTLSLSERAGQALLKAMGDTPMSKQTQAERIMEFYAEIPDSFRKVILGAAPTDMRNEAIDRAIAYLEGLKIVGHQPNGAAEIRGGVDVTRSGSSRRQHV